MTCLGESRPKPPAPPGGFFFSAIESGRLGLPAPLLLVERMGARIGRVDELQVVGARYDSRLQAQENADLVALASQTYLASRQDLVGQLWGYPVASCPRTD